MAKAKKNATRSGAKQRKHSKQHLTQAELSMQKSRALARRVAVAHGALEHANQSTRVQHRIVYSWGASPAAPSFAIVEAKS